MLTRVELEAKLVNEQQIKERLSTLNLAERLNSQFRNPHIIGGYLRNIALGKQPNDCDVFFEGDQLNQPGILEAVQEAEKQQGYDHFTDWEFENIAVRGYSGNLYEDAVGKYSHHTDFITMLMIDSKGRLYLDPEEKVLTDLTDRIYDINFSGVEMWAKHRGQGRSYESCICGDLIRGFYMCHSLELTPSLTVEFLMRNFDSFFNRLDTEDQEARRSFWMKKTKGDSAYQQILDKYGVKSLRIA